MKILKYIWILLIGFLFSCESSDIMLYKQNAGIYFESNSYNYTFLTDPQVDSKTLKLLVDISGLPVNYDREFVVVHPENDTITTAEDDQYKLGKGIVKADEYQGYIEIEVFKDDRLKDSVYMVALDIIPNEDFPETRLNKKTMVVSFTDKVIKPANWKWLRWYFGKPFSPRWWKFICEATGRTSLPYYPTHKDKETWWMSSGELKAYQTITRLALEKYNATHDEPLKHDEGDYKDQPVEMPN